MSYANEKGSYQKSLEITRENSNRSTTSLNTDFLKKSENYILNVTDFVTNTSPPMNLLTGYYFRIMPMGNQNETLLAAAQALPTFRQLEFEPTVYRSWLELGRQMELFFNDVSTRDNEARVANGDPAVNNYAVFYINQDGKLFLKLSEEFLKYRYIQFSTDVQAILGLTSPFVFKVRETAAGVSYTDQSVLAGGDYYSIFAAPGIFAAFNFRTHGSGGPHSITAARPLVNFEQRESIDVYSTFPLKSKILTFNGIETHEHILFRLPYAEQHSFSSTSTFRTGDALDNLANVSENLDVGLTNMCAKHADTLHQTLLSGIIRNVQLRIAIRYMTLDGIVERDMDFTNGFWYARLLFVKKI